MYLSGLRNGVSIPPLAHLEALVVVEQADATRAKQPAPLDGSSPVLLEPVGGVVVHLLPYPIDELGLQVVTSFLARDPHDVALTRTSTGRTLLVLFFVLEVLAMHTVIRLDGHCTAGRTTGLRLTTG